MAGSALNFFYGIFYFGVYNHIDDVLGAELLFFNTKIFYFEIYTEDSFGLIVLS